MIDQSVYLVGCSASNFAGSVGYLNHVTFVFTSRKPVDNRVRGWGGAGVWGLGVLRRLVEGELPRNGHGVPVVVGLGRVYHDTPGAWRDVKNGHGVLDEHPVLLGGSSRVK